MGNGAPLVGARFLVGCPLLGEIGGRRSTSERCVLHSPGVGGEQPRRPRDIVAGEYPSTPPGVGRSRRASGGSDALSGSYLWDTLRVPRGHRHFVPRRPGYERGTPTGVLGRACSLVGRVGRPAPIYWLTQHTGIRKDARSIGIGRGTKCRRPMYKRTH